MLKDKINFKVVSIVIVSFNSKEYLKNCIDSLIKYPPNLSKGEYEIIIIDNNSTDGSVKLIEDNYLNYGFIKLIKNNSNKGFAYASNQGIKESNSKYILLLNSDTEVFEGTINGLINFMENPGDYLISKESNNSFSNNNGKKIGIVGPKIINSDGSIQLSCRRFPSILNAAAHNILSVISPNNKFSRYYKLADIDKNFPFKVDWISGSAMFILREALNKIGLFDENYFMYVEDVDLCYRMWQSGYKVYYYPGVSVLHHIGKSGKENPVKSQIMMQKSALYFYIKIYKNTWKITLLPFVLPVLGFRILATWFKSFNIKQK